MCFSEGKLMQFVFVINVNAKLYVCALVDIFEYECTFKCVCIEL